MPVSFAVSRSPGRYRLLRSRYLYDERICRDRQGALTRILADPAAGVAGGRLPTRDGRKSLDITGPLEAFTGASRYQAGRGAGSPAYQVRVGSLGSVPVRTSSGLTLVPGTDLRASARLASLPLATGTDSDLATALL
jgi:hypothetical protein